MGRLNGWPETGLVGPVPGNNLPSGPDPPGVERRDLAGCRRAFPGFRESRNKEHAELLRHHRSRPRTFFYGAKKKKRSWPSWFDSDAETFCQRVGSHGPWPSSCVVPAPLFSGLSFGVGSGRGAPAVPGAMPGLGNSSFHLPLCLLNLQLVLCLPELPAGSGLAVAVVAGTTAPPGSRA